MAAKRLEGRTSLHPFEQLTLDFVRRHSLLKPGDKVLVGVSGGPDSVALLNALVSLASTLRLAGISILHFNHMLRGKDSEEDQAFVESMAGRLGFEFHVDSTDVLSYGSQHKVSLEMAARACRHRFFREAVQRLEAQALALGHTADDQAQEVLLRLFRGTGPSGMSGMPPKAPGGVIRPILFALRREVLRYIDDKGLSFREDLSNLTPFCQRNALRLDVFPLLEKHFHPEIVHVLSRHAQLVQDEEAFWNMQVRDAWPRICIQETSSRLDLRAPKLLALHEALQRRILRFAVDRLKGSVFGLFAVHVEAIRRLASGMSGRMIDLPGNLRAYKEGDMLRLTNEAAASDRNGSEDMFTQMIHGPGCYDFGSFRLRLDYREVTHPDEVRHSPPSTETAFMDSDTIQWPLTIRYWKPGDAFHPLGMRGQKKLQDFFTDIKVPKSQRNRIPLLCDQEKICWIIGYRLDDRVKVTAETRLALFAKREPIAKRERKANSLCHPERM